MFAKFFSFIFSALFLFSGSMVFAQGLPASASGESGKKVDVLLFLSPYCSHCQHLKREFLQLFIEKNKDRINLQTFDTSTPDGSIAYAETAKLYGRNDEGVPAMFVGESFLIGYPKSIGSSAEEAIAEAIKNGEITKTEAIKKISAYKNVPDFMKFSSQTQALPSVGENSFVGSIPAPRQNEADANSAEQDTIGGDEIITDDNLANTKDSKSFYRSKFSEITLWAIISAGLIDGINPCAFAVIIFFISFLAVYKYERKEVIAVGLAYCLAVFVTYLLLGLGLFKFLYAYQGFQTVMIVFKYLTIGLCAIFFVLTLYDFIVYQKTKNADNIVLQLSRSNKEKIHAVTRFFLRDKQKNSFLLVCAAFASGMLISLVEAICTGQVYLPTIALILKDTGSGYFLRAVEYLLLYNLMFIMPLLAVLGLTIAGYEAKSFNAFLKKYLGLTKFLLCLVFLTLLVLLLLEM